MIAVMQQVYNIGNHFHTVNIPFTSNESFEGPHAEDQL